MTDDATRAALEGFGLDLPHGAIGVITRGSDYSAAAVIDPAGTSTEPDAPRIRLVTAGDDRASALAEILDAVIDHARQADLERLTIGWDPMDHPALKQLGAHGFRPTGMGPYIELGGGVIQPVTGYQDATGSTLDLAWRTR